MPMLKATYTLPDLPPPGVKETPAVLRALLRNAVETAAGDDGWISLLHGELLIHV